MFGYVSSLGWMGVLTLWVFSSCVDDERHSMPSLNGRWELIKGLRNQKETETLSGTYFEFSADGKMITNLPVGPEVYMTYEVKKNMLIQKSTPEIPYEIRTANDSILVLGLELRGMQFELHLQKAPPEPEPPSVLPDSLPAPVDSVVNE